MSRRLLVALIVSLASIAAWSQPETTDTFSLSPYGTFNSRRAEFLKYYAQKDTAIHPLYCIFRQIVLAASGQPLEQSEMERAFMVIKSNRDCNDFSLNGLLRLKKLYPDAMSEQMHRKAEERILDFKYWWDDARPDTTYRCYHTENHQAIYHAAELIAGQMYRERTFSDGNTGEWHINHALNMLLPWLDFRFRFGFSEWNSTYYDAETMLLINLFDFAEQPEVRRRAENLLNLLFFDMALANFRGFMGGASSRNYAHSLLFGTHNTSPLMKLAFGVGCFTRDELMGSTALATGSYRCPALIEEIASDYSTPYISYQRNSIEPDDAGLYGLGYESEGDCRLFWGMQEFIHPKVIALSKQISERYNVWPYGDYDRHIQQYKDELEATGTAVSHDRFALSEGNIVTARCPDYMLSTVCDFRKGRQGYQQHVWQATLSNTALVYTNSPGGTNLKSSPNYWGGSERLPRAAQHGNVSVIIYNNAPSHAYFPEKAFDEVVRKGSWTFGKKGKGYVALFSSSPTDYAPDFRGEKCDIKTGSLSNIYICEVGNEEAFGNFNRFVDAIGKSEVSTSFGNISYSSPSQGKIEFGWDTPLKADGKEVELRRAVRYHNPWCQAPFDTDTITISRGDKVLTLTRKP